MAARETRYVCVGRIVGVFGVRGWVKIHSYTSPVENILRYTPWHLDDGQGPVLSPLEGRPQGNGVIARLEGVDDRDQAQVLVGHEVWVARQQFDPAGPGEYYWADLEGLEVVTTDGVSLGSVTRLIETGANDVLVVNGERERLIPFLYGQVVLDIDLKKGLIEVDWDPEF